MPSYGSVGGAGCSHFTEPDDEYGITERHPLLHDELECKPTITPLPKDQLTILCLLRVLDPLAFSQIFPYINNFMEDLHLTDDPSQIGFYSGLVESVFALVQLLAIYPWARASDIVGRRPVILLCVTGLTLTTLLFGLSSNFYEVMISRALSGLFTGNIAVIPSVLCEITDESNQAIAFPIFGIFWPIGAIIGPLIGGSLSNPARRYPEWFTHALWKTYPYFLPCLIAAVTTAIVLFLSYFLLKESFVLPSPNRERESRSDYCSTINTSLSTPPLPKAPSMRKLLKKPIIRSLCLSGFTMNFTTTAFDVVFVLFCYTHINLGGLGFTESQIGYSLSISGVLAASLQIFVMPTLLRRYDHAKLYTIVMCIWPLAFLSLPLLNFLARAVHELEGGSSLVWIGVALSLFLARVGFLTHSLNMLLVKRYAPPSALASTNGLVQFATCLARAISPALISSLFAVSTNHNLLNGSFWVVVMVLISAGSAWVSQMIIYCQ